MKIKEKLIKTFFLLNGLLVVGILIGIFLLLIKSSLPAFSEIDVWQFFSSTRWEPTSPVKEEFGILSMIVSTLMVTIGAMIISIPLGLGVAMYLSDLANHKVKEIAKPVIEILAGIPSVVIGFLGIVVVGPFIAKIFDVSNGLNALNGSILLSIMALPTIISISEDALNSVPQYYTEASLSLGASKWETLIHVKIPVAKSGIIASFILGMGRAIGETMTVLMATGCAIAMPTNLLDSVQTMTATIAIEMGEVAYNTTHYYGLFAVGLVLFIMTFIVNLMADYIIHRKQKI